MSDYIRQTAGGQPLGDLKIGRDIRGQNIQAIEAYIIGQAIAEQLADRGVSSFVIGRDIRHDSEHCAASFANALAEKDIAVYDLGVCDTPSVYYAVSKLGVGGGAMTTASHNPPMYTGFKIVLKSPQGIDPDSSGVWGIFPIVWESGLDRVAEAYEKRFGKGGKIVIDAGDRLSPYPPLEAYPKSPSVATRHAVSVQHSLYRNQDFFGYVLGTADDIPGLPPDMSFEEAYIDFSERSSDIDADLSDLKIVLDFTDGVAGAYIQRVLQDYGANIAKVINGEPNPDFPCDTLDPLKAKNIEQLSAEVRKAEADAGFKYDPDGDRFVLVDEKGERVIADKILLLLAEHQLNLNPDAAFFRGMGDSPHVVYDCKFSEEMEQIIEKMGGQPVRTVVGHSYMQIAMRDTNAPLGADASHYYWRCVGYGENTMLATLLIADAINKGKSRGEGTSQVFERFHLNTMSEEASWEETDKQGALLRFFDYVSGNGGTVLQSLDRRTHLAREQIEEDYERYAAEAVVGSFDTHWQIFRFSGTEPSTRTNLQLRVEGKLQEANRKLTEEVQKIFGVDISDQMGII